MKRKPARLEANQVQAQEESAMSSRSLIFGPKLAALGWRPLDQAPPEPSDDADAVLTLDEHGGINNRRGWTGVCAKGFWHSGTWVPKVIAWTWAPGAPVETAGSEGVGQGAKPEATSSAVLADPKLGGLIFDTLQFYANRASYAAWDLPRDAMGRSRHSPAPSLEELVGYAQRALDEWNKARGAGA